MTINLTQGSTLNIVVGGEAFKFYGSAFHIDAGSTFNAGAPSVDLNGTHVTIQKGGTMNLGTDAKVGYATTVFDIYGENGLVFGDTWTDVEGKQPTPSISMKKAPSNSVP